jgi:stress-induced morphogen
MNSAKKSSMTPEQLKARIETLHADTQVQVTDLTGTMDHYQVTVVSPVFEGKMMIEQHQMIMGILKKEIDSDEVHALSMKTFTPAQYQKFGGK